MSAPTTTDAVSSSAKRSWRCFTLRALFLVVLAAAICFGWVAYRLREFQHFQASLEDLQSRGFNRIHVEPAPRAMFWRALGIDAVQASIVDLRGDAEGNPLAPTADDVRRIAHWTTMTQLHLSGPNITDDSLREFANLKALERLSLEHTLVTDAGLIHLLPLPRLQHFGIGTPRERILRANGGSVELPSCSRVTAAGIEAVIARMSALRSLWVEGESITDKTVERIADGLPYLHTLGLYETGITDSGMRHLARLSALSHLSLRGSAGVTDAGFNYLYKCRTLKTLRLEGTQVSGEAVRAMSAVIPLIHVDIIDVSRTTEDVNRELLKELLRHHPVWRRKMEDMYDEEVTR